MIPTRRKIGRGQAEEVAGVMRDALLAGWGLGNASRIVRELRGMIRKERVRRAGIDKRIKDDRLVI